MKILLINKSEQDLSSVYSEYKDVIFYDGNLPYASRLLSLSVLKDTYILFIHDIDIVIEKDDVCLEHIKNYRGLIGASVLASGTTGIIFATLLGVSEEFGSFSQSIPNAVMYLP